MLINCITYVAKSEIHGQGLYTINPIKKGTPIWYRDQQKDITIRIELIPQDLRCYLDKYSTVSRFGTATLYHLDGDDTKFMNHSEDPNIKFIDHIGIALRDIEENEELTCNYKEITTPEHFELLMLLQHDEE